MSKSVLAVDDSLTIRQLVHMVLTAGGYRVTLAEDGLAALDMLASVKPDLVITDVNMPRLDGLSLVERIRTLSDYRSVPVLVLTTESAPEKKARAREAGATGWIVKPFNPQQLLATVSRVLA
jgi:two-component system chemotaxis response regulator CheY